MTPIALDIFIAFIILLSTVVAYLRGMIKEAFTILAFLVGSFVAYKAGHLLVPEFNEWLNVPSDGASKKEDYIFFGALSPAMAAKVGSYGGVFLIAFLVVTLIGMFLTRWMKEVGIDFLDSMLGGAFGFLRGFLLVFLIYVPFSYVIDMDKMPDWAKDSYSVAILQDTFEWANKEFELDSTIEDRSGGIMIKFDKIDPAKLGKVKEETEERVKEAKEELRDAIKREEREVQKGGSQPAELLNEIERNIGPSTSSPAESQMNNSRNTDKPLAPVRVMDPYAEESYMEEFNKEAVDQ